jgi:hypothetical protein
LNGLGSSRLIDTFSARPAGTSTAGVCFAFALPFSLFASASHAGQSHVVVLLPGFFALRRTLGLAVIVRVGMRFLLQWVVVGCW